MQLDHARILNAYLCGMTISDLENILSHHKTWVDALMNCKNSEIDKCRAGFYGAVANSTNNLVKHNFNYIEQVINEEIGVNHA